MGSGQAGCGRRFWMESFSAIPPVSLGRDGKGEVKKACRQTGRDWGVEGGAF